MIVKPICLAVSFLCKKENNVYFQEEHHINIWRCQKHVPPFTITYVINTVNENEANRANVHEITYSFLLFNLNNN